MHIACVQGSASMGSILPLCSNHCDIFCNIVLWFPIFICGRFLILQIVTSFYHVSCSRNQWCNQNHFCSNYIISRHKSIECWQWCIGFGKWPQPIWTCFNEACFVLRLLQTSCFKLLLNIVLFLLYLFSRNQTLLTWYHLLP